MDVPNAEVWTDLNKVIHMCITSQGNVDAES